MTKRTAGLVELQTLPIPRCTSGDFELVGLPTAEADDYLQRFVPPRANEKGDMILCVCGARLFGGGMMGAAFFATFTWGLVHGEGICRDCGYPTRMYHQFSGDKDCTFPLQYHPDDVEQK